MRLTNNWVTERSSQYLIQDPIFSFLGTSLLAVTPTFGEVDVIATKQNIFIQNSWLMFSRRFWLKFVHISVKLGVFLSRTALQLNFSIAQTNVKSNFPRAYITIVIVYFRWGLKRKRTKHQIFSITQKTGRYAFSNVKLSKKLCFFLVAEAHGLIYPRPSGENFSFAHTCLMMGEAFLETSPKNTWFKTW